jgi:site-specific DNA recombinase
MKTAFLYIRVSTDEQADTGYSQRSQDEMLRRYCSINNIQVKAVYFEDHSAKTFNRPEFTKLLINLKKHKGIADLVLFTKWDRFSRNAGDAYGMISTLNKLGVEPQAVEQPLDLSVPENKMMLAFYLAAPEVENDRRALNVLSGMRRAQKEGRWMGIAPVGYKNKISEGGKKYIAPDPVEAPIMQWVFKEIANSTFTTEAIWKRAKEMGLRCSKNNFWAAIRNPVYCGKIRVKPFKGEEEQLVSGQHESLISEYIFYKAQDVLDGKKKVQRTKIEVDDRFPLRGFLLCPRCGANLTASSSKGRKVYYHYYHCTSSCGIRFNSETVNEGFVQELQKWKPHPAIPQLYKLVLHMVYNQNDSVRRHSLVAVKDELQRQAMRHNKARELLLTDSMDPDDYRAIKRECEAETSKLEAKLSELTTNTVNIESMMEKALLLLNNVDIIYRNAGTLKKRELIGSMFPQKLEFDGEHYRTAGINEAVQLIFNLGKAFGEIKMGQTINISGLSHEVIPLVPFSNHFIYDLKKLAQLQASITNVV